MTRRTVRIIAPYAHDQGLLRIVNLARSIDSCNRFCRRWPHRTLSRQRPLYQTPTLPNPQDIKCDAVAVREDEPDHPTQELLLGPQELVSPLANFA